jgi:hypothetical protein
LRDVRRNSLTARRAPAGDSPVWTRKTADPEPGLDKLALWTPPLASPLFPCKAISPQRKQSSLFKAAGIGEVFRISKVLYPIEDKNENVPGK